jgi:predicted tellurium resistance membrane protein TerC
MIINLWQIIFLILVLILLFSDINTILNNIKKNIKNLKKIKIKLIKYFCQNILNYNYKLKIL